MLLVQAFDETNTQYVLLYFLIKYMFGSWVFLVVEYIFFNCDGEFSAFCLKSPVPSYLYTIVKEIGDLEIQMNSYVVYLGILY